MYPVEFRISVPNWRHRKTWTCCTYSALFAGINRPRRGVFKKNIFSEIKECLDLNFYSSSGNSCPIIGW